MGVDHRSTSGGKGVGWLSKNWNMGGGGHFLYTIERIADSGSDLLTIIKRERGGGGRLFTTIERTGEVDGHKPHYI